MSIKRRSFIVIGVLAALGVAFWWRQQAGVQAQVQMRLGLARTHVSDTAEAVRQALAPDFAVSGAQTIKTSCEEKSPELSFTRLYDCNATAKIELSNVQTIPADRTEALIKASLIGLGIAPSGLENVDRYMQNMSDGGFWQTEQPINIPSTAIAGVPPFDYYGGLGQEDIGIQLTSKIDQVDPKKTILLVTAIQEYHTCKSFFLPCAH